MSTHNPDNHLDQPVDKLVDKPLNTPLDENLNGNLNQYLDQLASRTATPGGGAVAALTGAQAAALVSMVARFSNQDITDIALLPEQADTLRKRFLTLAQEDAEAFELVMVAFRQKAKTEDEKLEKHAGLQSALINAIAPPRETSRLACSLLAMLEVLMEHGNQNLVTDTGIAALLAIATIEAAEMNILVNLRSLEGGPQKQELLADIQAARAFLPGLQNLSARVTTSLTPE